LHIFILTQIDVKEYGQNKNMMRIMLFDDWHHVRRLWIAPVSLLDAGV